MLGPEAWSRFAGVPEGWPRVQAICDFVHNHIRFGYGFADNTRTASGGLRDGRGVCRDFAHLAITLCRAMNIPARYCTGYLGDIGVPHDPAPMDFRRVVRAYLDGRWYSFDARHNIPRIGRIVMARGRDARMCHRLHLRPSWSRRVRGVDRGTRRRTRSCPSGRCRRQPVTSGADRLSRPDVQRLPGQLR